MVNFVGKTALIIEDDKLSIKVMEELLRQSGVSSIALKEGSKLASQLEALARPDVIFLDLEMPEINGYQVLEMIKSQAHLAHVPVLAYTTHISHLNDVKRAGFNGFLGKPLDNRSFPKLLEKILAGEAVWEVPT